MFDDKAVEQDERVLVCYEDEKLLFFYEIPKVPFI